MTLRIEADLAACQGYANCIAEAPEYFAIDDEGRVDVLRAEVIAGDERVVRDAVRSCPVNALTLIEEGILPA